MVSLTLCFSFTFFPFRCLELYQKLFFLLFSFPCFLSLFCLFPPVYAPFSASFYRFPLHIFSATPLPDFTPLFSFFCISFTSFPILFAWNFTRNGFFHFFTISLFLFSLPYSASLVFPLLFVPFYLLGSLPETVFSLFYLVSLTLCFSFTFFPFHCLELYQKLFFLLFSYIATYVHAWNFTRSCSFSTFLFMSVAT